MDPIMDVIKNSEEPEWLEKRIIGELRLWQIMFLCLAGVTSLSKSENINSLKKLTPAVKQMKVLSLCDQA